MRHRNILISADNFTTYAPKVKPRNILPTSPIKTLARGRLRGRNPRQADASAILVTAISLSLKRKSAKKAIKPNPISPVTPAMPLIPSMKL